MPGRTLDMERTRNDNRFLSTFLERLKEGKFDTNEERRLGVHVTYSAWWSLVETYSDCQLTKDDDMLVAISSIARIMAHAVDDEYLARLWRRTLMFELLWASCNASTQIRLRARPFPPLAPIWTWASYKGKVFRIPHRLPRDYNYTDSKGKDVYIAEIPDCSIDSVGDDKTGK
jgi:hypothetical protein